MTTPPDSPQRVVAHGPGRVNLIGEHTDYNDGLCLPFAIERGVTVTATALETDEIHAQALDLDEEDHFPLSQPERTDGWRAFVRGVVAELRPARGAGLEIEGDVPQGAGLSSSAALEAALCLALLGIGGQPEPDRVELAKLCSRVENDWVGAETGLLDQLAALCCEEGHALRIDVQRLQLTQVPLDLRGWRLATIDSHSGHSHAESSYNERRAECREACERLGIESLRAAEPERASRLPDPFDRRARHVIEENARVDEAVKALRGGDMQQLARLLDASHASLRDLYDASVPAVERVVETAKQSGAAGARMVGGGFGGAVLALFPPDAALPYEALAVKPGPPARLIQEGA